MKWQVGKEIHVSGLTIKSLDGATSVGSGKVIKFDYPRTATLQAIFTGRAEFGLVLEGSLDGVNFSDLASASASRSNYGGIGTLIVGSSIPVLFYRANFISLVIYTEHSGDPAPTVTATIAGHVD